MLASPIPRESLLHVLKVLPVPPKTRQALDAFAQIRSVLT